MVQNFIMLQTKYSTILQSKRNMISKCINKYWQYYLLILPTLAYFIIFKYLPIYGIQIAFKNFSPSKGIFKSTWIGFDNFTRFFNSFYFMRLLSNTILVSLYELAFFPLPILFALSLNEVGNLKFRKTIQTVTYAPYFLSTVVFVSLILAFLDPVSGIINKVIVLLGGAPTSFISDPTAFKTIYVLSGVWKTLGWNAIIYLGTLANADPALHEAAQIDGASRLQRIWHINLPCLAPTVVILFILRLGSIMSVGYERVYLMQNSLNMPGSDIISTYVYRVDLIEAQYGLSAAVGLFNSVINVMLLLMANALSKRLTESSLW
jgi:putative aldouronate transport system permease protein